MPRQTPREILAKSERHSRRRRRRSAASFAKKERGKRAGLRKTSSAVEIERRTREFMRQSRGIRRLYLVDENGVRTPFFTYRMAA